VHQAVLAQLIRSHRNEAADLCGDVATHARDASGHELLPAA
jgi:hypothetical protein